MKHATWNIKYRIYNLKLSVMAIFLLFVSCFMFHVSSTLAQVQLETGLPNVPSGQLPAGQELPSYINYLFIFGLGLIAFLALGQMMIGGLTYILAAGNVAKVETAKDTIQQALLGLGLLLVSYLLLRTINPDLVNLRNPNLTPTSFQGGSATGTTVAFYWEEPPSCPENWYQTNEGICTGSKPFPNFICCTNEPASVHPLSDYYMWERDQCKEGENKVENNLCKGKKPWIGWVCCYVP